MIYIQYLLFAIFSLVVTVVAIIGSSLIALFVQPSGYLPQWLSWFQTVDEPATGDPNWNMGVVSYKNTVLWLIRNPAQGFDSLLGARVSYDMEATKIGNWTHCNGYFEYGRVIPFAGGFLLISFGWRLKNILMRYPHLTQGQLISWPVRWNKSAT